MSESKLQDRYLDLLLELVFEEQEEKEVQRLAQSPDPELTEEESNQAKRILEKAFQETDDHKKAEAGHKHTKKGKKLLKGLLSIAAILLLLSSIGMAASAEFREAFLRMFIRVNEQSNSVWIYPDEEIARQDDEYFSSSIKPPEQWAGRFYLFSVPEGFVLDEKSVKSQSVRYTNGQQAFTFTEHFNASENERSLTGLDYVLSGEKENAFDCARFAAWEDKQVLAWDDGFSWFELIGEKMEREELISIANAVLPLRRGSITQAKKETDIPIAVPPLWGGEWFPAFLPGGLHIVSFSHNMGNWSIHFSNDRGLQIVFYETDGTESLYKSLPENTLIDTIALGDGEATLIDGYPSGSNSAEVAWRVGEKTLCVSSIGYHRDGTVRIAESVRRMADEEKRQISLWTSDAYEIHQIQPPEIWKGKYFPAYLPNGFELKNYSLTDQDTEEIRFCTADYGRDLLIRRQMNAPDLTYPGNGTIQSVSVLGESAFMMQNDSDGRNFVQMMFPYQDTWYSIISDGIDTEEVLRIAQSLRENGQGTANEPEESIVSNFEQAETPISWAGHCFPDMIPRDLVLTECSAENGYAAWQGENGREMIFQYHPSPSDLHFGETHVVVTSLTVNGCCAYMMEETVFSVPRFFISWQDQSGVYTLRFSHLDREEVLAIVDNMRPL